jgi:hypothetical protein
VRAAGYEQVELLPLSFGIATLTIATRAVNERPASAGGRDA